MLAKIKNPVENNTLEIDPDKALKRKNAGYGEVEPQFRKLPRVFA